MGTALLTTMLPWSGITPPRHTSLPLHTIRQLASRRLTPAATSNRLRSLPFSTPLHSLSATTLLPMLPVAPSVLRLLLPPPCLRGSVLDLPGTLPSIRVATLRLYA